MKIVAILLCFVSLHAQAAWDLNDVSYLMPLPSTLDDSSLLRVSSKGKNGELIPERLLNDIPFLSPGMDWKKGTELLRVFGVRIDPCFPLPTPQSCQKQIRLMWQPVDKDFDGQVQSVDASLHSFYVLDDTAFTSLLKDLTQWKKQYNVQTGFLPLQVHPAWAAEGLESPSLTAFHKIILKYIGNDNLTRVTAMLLRQGGLMWTFAGFEKQGSRLRIFEVPRLEGKQAQAFMNFANPPDSFYRGGISPFPRGDDTLNTIVSSSDLLEEKDEDTIRREVGAAFRVENPSKYTPENMDCATCHVAQLAIHWVLKNRPHMKADQIWSSEIYKNPKYNLSNQSGDLNNMRIVRGFGYFGKEPAISQRVINESAEVADALNILDIQSRVDIRP